MHNVRRRTALIFACVFFPAMLFAQVSSAPAYKVKAVFLFNFTRFIDWPENAFTDPAAPFVIGIAGNNPFGNFLEQSVSGEKVGTHPILIQQYKTAHENFNCHVLFVNFTDEEKIREVLSACSKKGILTVGDDPDFDKYGGIIRFYTEEDKIRLVINTDAARNAHLQISSKLLSVAKTN
jgi:hypothetical protein